MDIITIITFMRSFTRGGLNDGSLPALPMGSVLVCPSCGGTEIEDNGRLLTCLECLEIGSQFDFIETTTFGV